MNSQITVDFNPLVKSCAVALGCSIFAIFTTKYFWFKQKLPKRGIVIRYKDRFKNTQELLIIKSDTPRKLYLEIMDIGPYRYISEKYGMSLTFQSIEVIGDDIDYEDTFLIKIAKFMNLDTNNIHNKEDLVKLIDDHMTYNPDMTINAGYEVAKNNFERISNDV